MIITLTGPNTFALAAAEKQITAAFAAKHGAAGIERVEGEPLEPARLPDLLQGATLFAPVRLVLLRNISANKTIHPALLEMLPRAAAETTVVITDPAMDKRTKLYAFLKAHTTFKDFIQLKEPQLLKWLQQTAGTLGGQLSPDDARYLLGRVGTDQWRLSSELQKLVDYQPVITRLGIGQLVEVEPAGTAFDLLDAALAGDRSRTMELISVLRSQEDPYKFFGLLSAQVQALAVAAVAGERSADVIAKDAGLHPFVVRKIQAAARRLGQARAAHITKAIADCDWRLKTTGADPWHLLAITMQKMTV